MAIPSSVTATGYILSDGTVPTAADTVTIAGHVYTWRATPTTTADEVKIGTGGTAVADSMSNLAAAINKGAGSGTLYGSLTVLNADCYATSDATKTYLWSKVPGTVGNFLSISENGTHTSASGALLTGGTGSIAYALQTALAECQMNSQLEGGFATGGKNPTHA